MPIRAKYVGPHEAVLVVPPDSPRPIATVKRNGLLPADVPAAIRDGLLETEDWKEVKDPAGPSSSTAPSTSDKE